MERHTNPLLEFDGLTRYGEVRAEHVAPALELLLAQAEAAQAQAAGDSMPADYDTLSAVLDVAVERLGRAWGVVRHLEAVASTPAMRDTYNANLDRVTAFFTQLGADERLYAKYKAMAQPERAAALTPARRRALSNALRDFVLSGAELQGEARERFAQIQARCAQLSQQFSQHVMDATDGWSLYVEESRLEGVPADLVQAARAEAQAEGREGCKLTLHAPRWIPVMTHATRRELREQLYRAYMTRASEQGDPALDNSALMPELLALRQQEARLLGHASYAEVSLVPKMAGSPQEVIDFLRDLARRARPGAERDLAALRDLARREHGIEDFAPWDTMFIAERLQQRQYAFSEEEVRAHLPLPRVLDGLFYIIETLFDVRIRPVDGSTWHESVTLYRMERAGGSGDAAPQTVAHFYLDLYARPGKRPGAWMDDARSRWSRPDTPQASAQTPVAMLVCNFLPPQGGKPSLLTHDDLITLFHEFGHGLQQMLTAVDELAVSGLSGVEWDAVELPSQFMENFCWEWDVLKRLSAHADTGEPMPRELFERMRAARNFQSGLQTLRQVEYALFDMRLHAEPDAARRIDQVLAEVRAETALMKPPAYVRPAHTFSHIFAGGYAAGYYSYKWAEVLSADAWSAFEEAGVLDAETGRRWRREVLETGGSRPAMESFVAFRGREPRIDALLRHQGLDG